MKRDYKLYLISLLIAVAAIILGIIFYFAGKTIIGKVISISTPMITAPYGTSGMAPYVLHAHALDSELGAGDVLTATYEWDFGDVNGRYNKLKGWNVAHVYEKPGTYTLTLKITNEAGRSKVVTKTIDIQPDTRKKIYVSNSGNDNNNGLSASRPVKTINKGVSLMTDNSRILLRRGDTFNIAKRFNIPYKNVIIGAYGTGSKPIIRWVGSGDYQFMFSLKNSSTGISTTESLIFENIIFDSSSTTKPSGIQVGGTNIAIRNSEFRRLSYGINTELNPKGLLVQDNSATLPHNEGGLSAYFIWIQGEDIAIIGNKAYLGDLENPGKGGSHTIRTSGTPGTFSRLLVANNDFKNYDRTSINIQRGSYAYVVNNKINGAIRSDNNDCAGHLQVGPLGKEDGLKDPDYAKSRTEWVVVENNKLYVPAIHVRHGAEHVMIRNNIRKAPNGGTNVPSCSAIFIEGKDYRYGDTRTVYDLRIKNNVATTYDDKGRFLKLESTGSKIVLENNVFIAPNIKIGAYGSAPVYIDVDLSSFSSIKNNTWPNPTVKVEGGINYVAGEYVAPSEWNANSQVTGDRFLRIS